LASGEQTLSARGGAASRSSSPGCCLISSGTAAAAIPDADFRLPVPAPSLPLLSPLLSVAPGQVLAWALARAKGLDADNPAGLTKITLAR
jgi:glucosamine 6-phosphate synthetase-like amidotransferase/phosphosugar isomerase protein